MKDSLGDRMKEYEDCYRIKITKRSYVMMRIDGKAFHTYTKGLMKPFDDGLIEDMNETATYLCKNIMNAKFAYVQSDEISILLADTATTETQAWFDNNLQKMVSVAASMATAKFNQLRLMRLSGDKSFYAGNNPDNLVQVIDALHVDTISETPLAMFDARAWVLPSKTEVINYLIWRQQDATRNSISSVAQSLYSHKELEGVDSDAKQEMIFQKGINWDSYDSGKKRGRFIEKVTYVNSVNIRNIPLMEIALNDTVRNKWEPVECSIFTQDKNFLSIRIPSND